MSRMEVTASGPGINPGQTMFYLGMLFYSLFRFGVVVS